MKFANLYEKYWTRHVQLRLRSPENVYYFWKVHGPRWVDVDVESVTAAEIQEWFDDLAVKSKSAAVRAVNMLSAIINWGIRRGYVTCANPCKNVEKIRLIARERFLMPDEIDQFKKSLGKAPQTTQDIFWLCLLTGARRGNVLSMRWDEIDSTLAVWRIPAEKHKNGRSHLAPLSAAALAILERRKANSSSEYVFPGKGKTGHIVEPKRSWAKILKRAGISDLTIHDLRRTLGSYMAINGAGDYVIGRAMGHVDPRSTKVYARLNLQPVRDAMTVAQSAFL